MNIALLQYNPKWEGKEENRKRITELIERDLINRKNFSDDSTLLIFPEMTLTGFTMNPADHGEPLKGNSYKFFSKLADEYKIYIAAGIIEKENGNYFNSLIFLNPQGELISSYRKIHPFSYAKEDKNYNRGKEIKTEEIDKLKVGLSICYDLRFPELYRFYGKEKVHLIIVIANWPDTRIDHWNTLLKARAIENQCYIAGVNRTGDDPNSHYPGFSAAYDPMGKEIISIHNEERIVFTEIHKEKVDEVRKKLPFLQDVYLI